MAQAARQARVADQIRADLAELLAREVHDPGIGFVTLTRAKVSSDLQVAHVFYTTIGDHAVRRNTARALERATPFLRRQIGARLRLRRVPELKFIFDESIEGQDRIERLIQELHETDAARQAASAAPPAASAAPDDHSDKS